MKDYFVMFVLGERQFSGEEVHGIFKVISAILKLGNLNFVPTTNMDGTEGCAINNDYGKCKCKFFPIFRD